MPVQGTAADMMKLAMIAIATEIEKAEHGDHIKMLLQVHDELVFEVADEQLGKEPSG